MRIKNTTDIPNELVREIITFVKPSGIKNFDVMVKNGERGLAGNAYYAGSGYHATSNPFVVCRVPKEIHRYKAHYHIGEPMQLFERANYPRFIRPYQYAHLKGKKYWIANRIEALVYLMAHELRHLWQAKTKNKSGYYFGARGRFSEIDSESYAIHCLREWKKQQ